MLKVMAIDIVFDGMCTCVNTYPEWLYPASWGRMGWGIICE